MTYAEAEKRVSELCAEIDDIRTQMYGIKPVEVDGVAYTFVCFYNVDNRSMETTIIDNKMVEIRLLHEITQGNVLIAYAAFCYSVKQWQLGLDEFPADITSETTNNNFNKSVNQILSSLKLRKEPREDIDVSDIILK